MQYKGKRTWKIELNENADSEWNYMYAKLF